MPFERRTRAIFRKAEFGFFGVVVVTLRQTPRLKGAPLRSSVLFLCKVSSVVCMAGYLLFLITFTLPFLTNWFTVGIFIIIRVYPVLWWSSPAGRQLLIKQPL